MALDEKIAKIRDLIGQRDEIDRQIVECLSDKALSVQASKKAGKRGRKANYEKTNDSDVMREAVRRHPATEQIEEMLIDGLGTAAIMEQVEVSAPTISVIRTRLKAEGRLT